MLRDFLDAKITYTLLVLNTVIYLLSAFLSKNFVDIDIEVLGIMGAIYGPATVLYQEWWRLMSALFLHGGIAHLLMNMFSLYIIGMTAERYFTPGNYISLYLISGILGGLVSIVVHPVSIGVGASGAIFGIFGALAGFFIAHREEIASHSKAFMKSFSLIIAVNLLIGLSIPDVDVSAHIGGLLAGLIGGYMLSKNSIVQQTIYYLLVLSVILCIAYYLIGQYAKPRFFL